VARFQAEPGSTWILNINEIHCVKQTMGTRKIFSIGYPNLDYPTLFKQCSSLF